VPRVDTSALAVDHPAFAGHFPGNPLLPGVVLLDAALHELGCALQLDLRGCRVTAAKFLAPVRPGDALHLDYEAPANGRVGFTISGAAGPVLRGVLDCGG
jgi:3-hydroxymyristoyl/3-hydroxydecanoyl-(acyl carrier protein) dehydratase